METSGGDGLNKDQLLLGSPPGETTTTVGTPDRSTSRYFSFPTDSDLFPWCLVSTNQTGRTVSLNHGGPRKDGNKPERRQDDTRKKPLRKD